MSNVIVYKNRTNILAVNLGIDVSGDTITSQIREAANSTSPLIASWVVSFKTNGIDGKLILTLDNSITATIIPKKGYMDMKRISGGEPLPVFDAPIQVIFKDTVTT
jgi:hypothetical protein